MSNLEHIGKYAVIRQLDAGGFGAVYLFRDPHLEQDVAIKLFQVRREHSPASCRNRRRSLGIKKRLGHFHAQCFSGFFTDLDA